jgi:ABC-2 type transport system ATP-binding protein
MVNIENLTFGYSQKKSLFDDLSLSLPAGNIYGLLGKNGAGKTSLLKIISGLLFPQSGKVDVSGFRPLDRNPGFLQEICFIGEEFTLPAMKPDTYVSLYGAFYPRFNHSLFNDCIYEFRLPREQKLTSMSYGQKKKFLLSFGIATDCRLLILDEPTNGLDIPSKSQFRKIIANAVHEDRSFIISTHQVRDMESLIDPIIILDEGRVIFHESSEEISKRLAVKKLNDVPTDSSIVYVEQSLGGYTVVRENEGDEDSWLNLEILFNAVINQKERMNQIFKH